MLLLDGLQKLGLQSLVIINLGFESYFAHEEEAAHNKCASVHENDFWSDFSALEDLRSVVNRLCLVLDCAVVGPDCTTPEVKEQNDCVL